MGQILGTTASARPYEYFVHAVAFHIRMKTRTYRSSTIIRGPSMIRLAIVPSLFYLCKRVHSILEAFFAFHFLTVIQLRNSFVGIRCDFGQRQRYLFPNPISTVKPQASRT